MSTAKGLCARGIILAAWPALVVAGALLTPRFGQDPAYHDFADQRALLSIPHFWNVVSNAAIAAAGVLGMAALRHPVALSSWLERLLWLAVFSLVLLTAAGSVYYHWHPGTYALFWDRLPIALTLALLLGVTLAERIGTRATLALLPLLPVLGAGSVGYWLVGEVVGQGDLRFYFAFQAFCLGGYPLVWVLFSPRYTGIGYYAAALAVYGLAVAFELGDRFVFVWLGFGGHAIKHLLVGVALAILAMMLRQRTVLS
jgi:hypothetical protein